MELEITWERTVKVWWAYLWRNLLAIGAAALIGGVIGGILGVIMAMIDASMETVKMMSSLLGIIIGLSISIIPIKLILGKDFGEFRLVLVKKENDTVE